MPKQPTNDVLKARIEAAELLGLNPRRLSPVDVLRCDLVATLRATIDHTNAGLLAGGATATVLAVHTSAIEQLRKLLPADKLEPSAHRSDWREQMLQAYFATRERAAQAGQGYDGLQRENERLRAEVEQLKALTGKTSEHSDIPMVVERVPVAAGNVVPLAPRSPPPATPQYNYETERGWRDHVLPDGNISSRPMSAGKYWGPV